MFSGISAPKLFIRNTHSLQNIQNVHLPVCKKCAFFIPHIVSNADTKRLGKCAKFGEMDIITGEITYYYADLCRNNESKCGIEGNEYVLKRETKE
jgi:hypothetical protein